MNLRVASSRSLRASIVALVNIQNELGKTAFERDEEP